jgi:hypothetical protein
VKIRDVDRELAVPTGAGLPPRRFLSRRLVWHTAGILIAAAVLWLIFRAYRQPEFLIDFANFRLC